MTVDEVFEIQLKPAILYKDEIIRRMAERNYSDDMLNYTGCLDCYSPNILAETDASTYQYAIVDGERLVGYFDYKVDWYSSCAHCFGLVSFEHNRAVGIAVYRELRKLIYDYHIHRIEWRMVGGNPVERHYDRFCRRYGGNKFVLTDVIKDRSGRYHNDVIYEIVFEERAAPNDCPNCGAKMNEEEHNNV